VRRHVLAYAAYTHVYTSLFLRVCICSCERRPTHMGRILRTQLPSYTRMALGRNLSLGIRTPFSSVLHLFAILTSFLIIFTSHYMPHITYHFPTILFT